MKGGGGSGGRRDQHFTIPRRFGTFFQTLADSPKAPGAAEALRLKKLGPLFGSFCFSNVVSHRKTQWFWHLFVSSIFIPNLFRAFKTRLGPAGHFEGHDEKHSLPS